MATHLSLVSLTRAVGAGCTLVALLSPSFGCSPVPFTPGAQSPYSRPVKPEDLYVEESEQGPPKIEPGDSIEVVVRRGAGEERSTVTVRDNGRVYVGSLDVEVQNLTVPEAEARLTEQLATIIRNPRVEVAIKQKRLQARKQRVFLIAASSGVLPGVGTTKLAEFDRKTTVGQLIAQTGYTESAVLDDIRVIRGDARKPEVIPVDIQRLFQYGDRSQDIVLKDNDIVFVPRQRIADWNAFLGKMGPTLNLLLGAQTLSPEALVKFLTNNNIQPVQVPTINVR
ncbi:MAG: polysaccharide biosynthesis/export family protein [Desulfomonile tiedjei]|nr:polysaccharide biosynthesis/export family protein [Desulfomonile tiedjei]